METMSDINWDEPMVLVEDHPDNGVQINKKTLARLSGIREQVVVAAIAGIYRTGKSFLMNLLAGKQGFELGSTIQSKTKGIWIWVRPHPHKPNCCLVILDTEGLADPERGNQQHDMHICVLTVLLACSLTYNSLNTIDNDAINKLHFVTEMAERVKVKSSGDEEDGSDFTSVFPDFIWSVRDFHLELLQDGRAITADDYLDQAIKLRKGTTPAAMRYNLPRECLRNYFPSRKCFLFPRPVENTEMLRNIQNIPLNQLDPEFCATAEQYGKYILHTTKPKQVSGQPMTGRMWGSYAECLVGAIQSNAIPCIETAVEATAQLENARAVADAVTLYRARMDQRVQLPTENVQILSQVHHECEKKAIALFLSLRVFDKDRKYQQQMAVEIATAYDEVIQRNEQESERICQLLIKQLSAPISGQLESGYYSKPGGYNQYKADMDQLQAQYNQTPGKGTKAIQVLSEFMTYKGPEAQAILAADVRLDAEQKKAEAERQRAEAAARDQAAAEEIARKTEQDMIDQKATYEENMRQLQQKMEEDMISLKEDNDKAIQSKLTEQEKLLKEGFETKAQNMHDEIKDIEERHRKQIETMQQESDGGIFGVIGKGIDAILSLPTMLSGLKK